VQRFLTLLLAAFVVGAAGPLLSGLSQVLGVALVVLSAVPFIGTMALPPGW
jgi:hypothetical protein